MIKNQTKFGFGIDKRAKNIEIKNLKIYNGEEVSFIKDNFIDQVFMLAVLEHLENPKEILKEVFKKLKKNGEIFIITPTPLAKPILNFLAFNLKLIDQEEIKEYRHYFSKTELFNLFKKIGLKEIKHKYFEFGLNQLIFAKK